jgi:hypothetical protein
MKHKMKFSLNTIRKKMLFYFLMSIILVSSVSVYLSINSNKFFRKIDAMFLSSVLLEDMQNYLAESEKNLALFIQTKDSDSKNNYQLNADLLNENAERLKNILLADDYNIERLTNLIDTFTENAEDAIYAVFRAFITKKYIFGDCHIRIQCQLLVYYGNPRLLAVSHTFEFTFFTLKENISGICAKWVNTTKYIH